MKKDESGFDRRQLIRLAVENLKYSYAPYSHYNVAAALLAGSGKIYTGVNVENASFPAGKCAEHNAITNAVGCGERVIVAMAIVGGPDYTIRDYCHPCGVCRQVMREFCGDPREMLVIEAKSETDFVERTLQELFPESFSCEEMK